MIIKAENPLIENYNTLHDTTPFDKIRSEHYEPAIHEGIKQQTAEIEIICNNLEAPSFKNTIVALERSGKLLERVSTVFTNLLSAETNDHLQKLAEKIMPILSDHSNNITLNKRLFERINEVYNQKDKLNLNPEDYMLLQETYDNFVKKGANLEEKKRDQYRKLTQQLSTLTLQFSQNILKETNNYELLLTEQPQLAGLPENVIESARQNAKEKNKEGWLFTLSAPSYISFMTYNENRELRKRLYMAYNTKCTFNNEYNNVEIVKQIVNTRMSIAQLLGYDNYAEYKLKRRMAKTSESVYNLLNQLLEAYSPVAQAEFEEIQKFARVTEGNDFQLMPWDWNFYSEKLKNHQFGLNDEMLRPYFELNKAKEGIFGLATKLYGITFKENYNIQVYHPDVIPYEVFDKNGQYLAILYTDFYPREGKRAGAWMTEYKGQWKEDGRNSRPHISIVTNFTKPITNKPALLSFNEVTTFLHEFGHALHGIFANSTYSSLSGTNVYWDFVELPSQIMENFAIEKDFLHTFAKHYETGEQLPDTLIQSIINASNFNVGYNCLRQLSFGYLDMAWYTRKEDFNGNIELYEKAVYEKTRILPLIEGTCMSTQFSHIFSGGYSAGYYSYKYAEVLDADAFSLFKEKGIFNKEVAESFRENILSKGGTEHPMILYQRFRGRKPDIKALLKRNGIE